VGIKTHTFRGVRHDITDITFTEEVDGLCIQPNYPKGEIILFTNRAPKIFLESAIHEALHALNWSIPEDVVLERAQELARWLWRLGYRRET